MSYANLYNPNVTPQNEPAPGKQQIDNNAGGFVFEVSDIQRLQRFLILGSDTPTYYQTARSLTYDNAIFLNDMWIKNPRQVADTIIEISVSGRAPKQEPAFFALALGAVSTSDEARKIALEAMPSVCRTASHLFNWISLCKNLGRGWGRGFKRAVANWYSSRNTNNLAYQMVKYRERNKVNHKNMILLSHKGAGDDISRQNLYRWVRGVEYAEELLPEIVQGYNLAKGERNTKKLVNLIETYKLPWEAVPNEMLREPAVWEAMIPHLGLTALIRNLGRITEIGTISEMNCSEVLKRLRSSDEIRKSRVHPYTMLQAHAVYSGGESVLGSGSWAPLSKITDALDEAFYTAFANVEKTNKRIMIGLDVSGSMGSNFIGDVLDCRSASAAMAMVTVAKEDHVMVTAFSHKLRTVNLSNKQRLSDIIKTIKNIPMGYTDCALPMLYASENKIPVDTFVIYTDNETYHGQVHPFQALKEYRKVMNIPAKLVVVGMVANNFTIADPSDTGMLDLVGFDSSCPSLISDFISDKI